MDELGELSKDEIDLVTRFRNGDRLSRARIVLASSEQTKEPDEDEMLLLKTMAAHLERRQAP